MPADESERMLSLSAAARLSGVSASRLRRLAAAGTLRGQKAGAYWVSARRRWRSSWRWTGPVASVPQQGAALTDSTKACYLPARAEGRS